MKSKVLVYGFFLSPFLLSAMVSAAFPSANALVIAERIGFFRFLASDGSANAKSLAVLFYLAALPVALKFLRKAVSFRSDLTRRELVGGLAANVLLCVLFVALIFLEFDPSARITPSWRMSALIALGSSLPGFSVLFSMFVFSTGAACVSALKLLQLFPTTR